MSRRRNERNRKRAATGDSQPAAPPISPSLVDSSPVSSTQPAASPPGPLGDGATNPGKYNMALVRRAIRNGWPIPDELRAALVEQMSLVMQTSPKERNNIAAAKVILQADKLNVDRERINTPQQVEMSHSGGVSLTHIRQELLQDRSYLEFLEQQAADNDSATDAG